MRFLVFIRENDFNKNDYAILKEDGYEFEFQDLEFADISSTQIRQMIKNNETTDGIIEKKVREYIDKNELYKN